jgi:hypothetical protein
VASFSPAQIRRAIKVFLNVTIFSFFLLADRRHDHGETKPDIKPKTRGPHLRQIELEASAREKKKKKKGLRVTGLVK